MRDERNAAAGHGFEQREVEAFDAGGEDEEVGVVEQCGDLGRWESAGEGEGTAFDRDGERAVRWAVADDGDAVGQRVGGERIAE